MRILKREHPPKDKSIGELKYKDSRKYLGILEETSLNG